MGGSMETFLMLPFFIVYLIIIIFLIKLAIRFVEAFEKISNATAKIADNFDKNQ